MSAANGKNKGQGEEGYPWFARKRFYLFSLPVLFGVISATAVSSGYYYYREALQRNQEQNRATAQVLSTLIQEHQKAALGIVQSYANRPPLARAAREKDPSQALPHLVSLIEKNPELDRAVLTDREGTVWANYPVLKEAHGENFSYRDWYRGVSEGWAPYVSRVFKRVVGEKDLAVMVCAPLFDPKGRVVGILGAVQRTVSLSRLISRAEPDPGRKVTLLDQAGNIIHSGRFPHGEEVISYPIPGVIEGVQKGKKRSIEFADPLERGRIKYAAVVPIRGLGWSVIVEKGKREVIEEYFPFFLKVAVLHLFAFLLGSVGLFHLRKKYIHRQTEMLLRSQMELAESERRYRSMLENVRMIAVGLDGEGNIDFVNPYLLEITGYSLEEVKGRSWFDLFIPEKTKGEIRAVFLEFLEKGLHPHHENFLRTRSGEERLIAWNNTLLKDSRGRTVGTMSLGEDVTDRRRMEEALKKSEETTRRLAEEQAVIGEIGRIVGSTLDIDSVYERFARTAGKLLDFDRISINIIDREKQTLAIAYSWGTAVEGRNSKETIPFIGSVTEEVFRTRKSVFIQTEDEDEWADRFPGYFPSFKAGLESALFTPLFDRDEVIGSLSFLSKRPRAYGDRDRGVGERIGHQIAGAIANSQLNLERMKAKERILASLHEKEVLLKEIHHRVKNNLQVISSLLNLQSRNVQDPRALEVFRESQNRVRSLALVHERLYRSPDFSRVDFGEYLRNMVSSLFSSYSSLVRGVDYEIDAGEIFLGVDLAIPCGLVLTELVSNALKHAFPDGKRGKVFISFRRRGDGPYVLRVKDNGAGFPPGLDTRQTDTLGFQLVHTLTRQLAGTLELNREEGTEITLSFGDGDPAGEKHG